jgi:hypothetical protein
MALSGIPLSGGIVVGVNEPLDIKYGPFVDAATALADVVPSLRYPGLVIAIIVGGRAKQYWWKDGILDTDLVPRDNIAAIFRDVAISTTIASDDVNNVVGINSTSARVVTLPNDTTATIGVGESGVVRRMNTGTVTFAPDIGVTINAVGLNIAARWVAVSWIKTASNTFEIWGALV